MLRTQRINLIRKFVFKNQTASFDELVLEFRVSKNTIRRDIQFLVESGELKKVYGGVAINPAKSDLSDDQLKKQLLQENSISKSAAQFVEVGDTIFIDSGLTVLDMIEFLKGKQITVVTNSLDFITHSLPYENITIIAIGNLLNHKTRSFTAISDLDILKSYNINKAFMAPAAISITDGVSHSTPLEANIKKAVMEKSAEIYILVEQYKIDKSALMSYCALNEVDYIITDVIPHEIYVEYSKSNGIQLIISNEEVL